jgi:hypothetical protein
MGAEGVTAVGADTGVYRGREFFCDTHYSRNAGLRLWEALDIMWIICYGENADLRLPDALNAACIIRRDSVTVKTHV